MTDIPNMYRYNYKVEHVVEHVVLPWLLSSCNIKYLWQQKSAVVTTIDLCIRALQYCMYNYCKYKSYVLEELKAVHCVKKIKNFLITRVYVYTCQD